MNDNYHGIVINVSQRDRTIFNGLSIIGKREAGDMSWVLFKLEVSPRDLQKVIIRLRDNLVEHAFYFHFYRKNELIVVFKERTFRTTVDPPAWREIVAYGLSLGIPETQLDFSPCRIEDEQY